jgi:hypothetical protein
VPLFTAGQPLTAAQLNGINGYVLKTADQSVTSSATLVDDTHLNYSITATGTYIVDIYLYAASAANAAGDLGIGFTFPTGTFHVGVAAVDDTVASGNQGPLKGEGRTSATSGSLMTVVGLSTNTLQVHVHGILIATATGTLRLQWAQEVSNASASTVKAGSHMLVRQVA